MSDTIKTSESMDHPYSFISYSHKDAETVYPILKELKQNGYRIVYDKHIESGTEWADRISGWLKNENCAKFIIFISQNSVTSEYVKDEVNFARKYSRSCLVVYLEEVTLEDGLELLLDRWQSIHLYNEKQDVFFQKLFLGIPLNTIDMQDLSIEEGSDFIEKYEIEKVLGKGGTAIVYKAKDKKTGADVTIKVANCSSEEKNTKNDIMKGEKYALAKINGPTIPKIIDFGESFIDGEKRYYMAESYVNGISLADVRCPLSEKEVAVIIRNVAQSLQYLHAGDINMVHCDIKPANIMIDQFDQTYVIDFGGCIEANNKTHWGTVTFAAPEQKAGENVDVRTDIYSLGITMKYLLCKDHLQKVGMTFNKVNHKPVREVVKGINPLLTLINEKMVDSRMENRFQSLEELIDTLQEFIDRTSDVMVPVLLKNQCYLADHSLHYEVPGAPPEESYVISHTAVLPISVALYTRDITTALIEDISVNIS